MILDGLNQVVPERVDRQTLLRLLYRLQSFQLRRWTLLAFSALLTARHTQRLNKFHLVLQKEIVIFLRCRRFKLS